MEDVTPHGDGWSLHHDGASLPARVRVTGWRERSADRVRAAPYCLAPA